MVYISKEKKVGATAIIIIIILSTTMIGIIGYYEIIRIENLNNYWEKETDSWESKYISLSNNYEDLEDDYNFLTNDYNELVDDYNTLYSPCTLIKDGEINWRFDKLDGTVASWTVDIDTYRAYVLIPEPKDYVSLYNSGTGETYYVKDLTEYVQPNFFSGVISGLTDGNSDEEFVAEVVNLKNQLITYGSGLGDLYRWSAETLTEGRGQCGDTSILVASLIKAGENKANYGIDVSFWYCDSDYMSNPQDVDHVIVEVEFSDGSYELIETTTDDYYTYDQIRGWKFEV